MFCMLVCLYWLLCVLAFVLWVVGGYVCFNSAVCVVLCALRYWSWLLRFVAVWLLT